MDRHFTATTYLYNHDFSMTLMIWHNKLESWLPPGGHIEKNETPEIAARREIYEETGITDIHFLSSSLKEIDERARSILAPSYILEEIISEGHHHMDMIFFATVKSLNTQSPEQLQLKWFTRDEILRESDMFENVRLMAIEGFNLEKVKS